MIAIVIAVVVALVAGLVRTRLLCRGVVALFGLLAEL